jgi:quinolinate synthase
LIDSDCLCKAIYRISPNHMAWTLEKRIEGRVVNRIQFRPNANRWARVALDRMLEV